MAILQLAWQRFGIIAKNYGAMQARVIATLLYFTVILPFGLLMQLGDHPFKQNAAHTTPKWETREPVEHSLEAAKRQG